MNHNSNTIKSQDDELVKRALQSCDIKSQSDLNPCNDGKRSSDVLIETINKCERLQKQLDIAKSFIFRCANDIVGDWYVNSAKCVLQKIEELNK